MDSAAWQTVLLALIAMIGVLGAPVIAWMLSSVAAKQSVVISGQADAKIRQEALLDSNKQIHETVNTNYQQMQRELEAARAQITAAAATLSEATSLIATLTENKRGTEERAAQDAAHATHAAEMATATAAGVEEGKAIAVDASGPVTLTTPVVNVSAPPNNPQMNVGEAPPEKLP